MTKSVYSVGQINTYIKNLFLQDYVLRGLYVRGEVSNCKYHSSGHLYFSIKDEKSVLSCVMFSGAKRRGLKFPMKNGDTVIVHGSINVYERDGKYQLYAEEITQAGIGLLYQRFEELKKKLSEMGMFAKEYKLPLPAYAKTVGIVTAHTGAAIRDIVNVAGRRNPGVQLILYPAKVQGEGAAESIVAGIRALNEQNVDVIIVGRGGGSIEDLWAFNEEIVARAIFESCIPIISAVGHETDVTIADYVADMRVPTPSAAAELAVFDLADVLKRLYEKRETLTRACRARVNLAREKTKRLNVALDLYSPKAQLAAKRLYLDDAAERMEQILQGQIQEARSELAEYERSMTPVMNQRLQDTKRQASDLQRELTDTMEKHFTSVRHQLSLYAARMEEASPLKQLSKGYAGLSDLEGHPVSSISQIPAGTLIRGRLLDGTFTAAVKETNKESI